MLCRNHAHTTMLSPTHYVWTRVLPFFTGVCVVSGLWGCGRPGGQDSGAAPAPMSAPAGSSAEVAIATAPAADGASANTPLPAAMPRKIIYNGTIELATDDWRAATKRLTEQVRASGGFVAEISTSGTPGESRTGTWKVRVPVARFEAFMASLGSLGETQSSGVTSEDVSEEFYDLEARLRNKRVEETRLIAHLQRSTGKLTEILAVEREISRVREEIERMEGRRRFLANRADLATVTITLREIRAFAPKQSPTLWTQMTRTFGGSLSALGGFAQALVLTLVALAPWLLVAAGVGYPFWRTARKKRARSPRVESTPRPAVKNDRERL